MSRSLNKLKKVPNFKVIKSKKKTESQKYFEEYSDKSYDELILLSKNNSEFSAQKKDVIRNLLQSKYENNFENRAIKLYPDHEDPMFNEKIFKKLEFYFNRSEKTEIDDSDINRLDSHSKKLCNISGKKTKKFNLTKNQLFLKSFLSPNSPYNSALLFHGTGVGKTCTSISIAEQYSLELKELNKKIIIVLNPNEVPDFESMLKNRQYDLIRKKITKNIKSKYSFFGYQKLANIVKKMEKYINLGVEDTQKQKKLLEEKIRDYFSDSVLIIDEAQNVKEGEMGKMLPPILEKIVRYSNNMKLILLSATPMFDNASEILWLINLLRLNDKKSPLKMRDYFDAKGNLKKEKESDFVKNTNGYISYMRGEDPYRFPKRIFMKNHKNYIKHEKMPKKDKKENLIENRINYLHLIGCPMKGTQLEIYKEFEQHPSQKGSFNQPYLMCSNIVFPNPIKVGSKKDNLSKYIGDEGFNSVLEKKKIGKKIKYKLKNESNNIFSRENIKNYSSKIDAFIENLESKSCEGIVFVYSQFINSGVVPLSLALEMNGYTKYDGSILENSNKPAKKGSYIIISGNKDLSKNAYENYIKRLEENKHGDEIKIIIGSETASEGLDFSYIREVHILEPWFHLNKIEQVIGRAIRNCSHIGLDYPKRNVKIFMYASTLSENPSNDNETIDLEVYRKAEKKHKQMADVEYLIKTNAVDCNINYHNNRYFSDVGNDYSMKCNYRKCDFKCNPDLVGYSGKINDDTTKINPDILKDGVEEVVEKIKVLFSIKNKYTLDEILTKIFGKSKDNLKFVGYYALNKILSESIQINDKNGDSGYLYYINGLYILIPLHYKDKIITNKLNKKKQTKKKIKIDKQNIFLGENTLSGNVLKDKKIQVYEKYYNYLDSLSQVDTIENINCVKIKENYVDIIPFIFNSFIDKEKSKKIKNKDEYRISPEEKGEFIKAILKRKMDGEELDKIESNIIEKSYNILRYKDIYRNESKYRPNKPDDLIGYRIISDESDIHYFEYSGGEFIRIQNLSDIKFNIQKKISNTKISRFIGYLEYIKKKESVVFKIRENNTDVKKTKIKRGSICSDKHGKKNEVIEYIKYLSGIDEKIILKKPLYDICMYLEFLMILSNIDAEEKCFFNPLETIEFELKK